MFSTQNTMFGSQFPVLRLRHKSRVWSKYQFALKKKCLVMTVLLGVSKQHLELRMLAFDEL
jgi:hypothetical protein